jgi:hypothetical protein
MRRDAICAHLHWGATIESSDEGTLWTKVYDNTWDDGRGRHYTDREMDDLLARGRATLIIVDKGLELEPIPSFDLEEGDYVVMTFGCWTECDPLLYDPAKSQILMRVAGWTNSDGDDNWVIALDAPELVMNMIDWSQYQGENGYDRDPLLLYVGPATVFHYVSKGQDHETWDDEWDWTGAYTFVDPPEVPAAWAGR